MRTLIREEQLRYIYAEEMRIVTNDKHIAEQIKTDKMESVVMNGSKVGKFGKIDGNTNLKSIVMNGVRSEKRNMVKNVVMNGVKSGKVGKLENCKSDEGMLSQSEERLCRSIIKGLAKTQPRKTHNVGGCGGRTRTRRHMLRRHHRQGVAVACSAQSSRIGTEVPASPRSVRERTMRKKLLKKYGVTPVDTK